MVLAAMADLGVADVDAIWVTPLLGYDYVHARSGEEVAEHHACGPSARNAATAPKLDRPPIELDTMQSLRACSYAIMVALVVGVGEWAVGVW
jgi:hypothetical protein